MSIAKNTKETFLEEIIDNLTGNQRDLPVDCKPKTREEILLAEIEKHTQAIPNMLDQYYDKVQTENLISEIELLPGPQGPTGEPGVSHEHDNKDVLDLVSVDILDDISKISNLETTITDHLENHPVGGGSISGDVDVSLENYIHKSNDKATYEDITSGDIKDNVYVTPNTLVNYLSELLRLGNINVLEVNGKTGMVTLTRDDLELNNVINEKQATEIDFKLHISDYDDSHITAQEKLNIYNRIAAAGQVHLGALPRSAKATVEEAILGEDDESYVTSRGLSELLTQEIGKVGTVKEQSVSTVNGRIGDIVLSREDIHLENVLNEKQATKVEFDKHLEEMENYHVSNEWRNSIINRVTALEKMVLESLSKDMKATTDLGLAGVDDITYVTPKVINEMINEIITQEVN